MVSPFLNELVPLHKSLMDQGIFVSTLDEVYLTLDGLLRAMNAASPPNFRADNNNEERSQHFNVFCANNFVPLMSISGSMGENFLLIGIVTHNADGKLRDANEVMINLEQILEISMGWQTLDARLRYIFLSPAQAQEIVNNNLVLDKRKRLHYLKGIDQDTNAMESFEAMLKLATTEGASDIHIEPGPKPRIRYRIDGVLSTGDYELTGDMIRRLVALIKNRANLKMDEHMVPQDGGIVFDADDIAKNPLLNNCSLRVSILPTIHNPRDYGGKVVLRVLKSKPDDYDIDKLGLDPDIQAIIERKISEPKGLILVTGPTGSGKTTTLYSMLEHINDGTRNITTVEDPVETPLAGIIQTPINESVGMSFAGGLRAILRQDPDVIMVGEIRDEETVGIALSASNTGHLVFSTVHADDSIRTLIRLQKLGAGVDSIASNLKIILSQRLARKVCLSCVEEYDAKDQLNRLLGGTYIDREFSLYRSKPGNAKCPNCGGLGYRGRFLLLEYWNIDEVIRDMIVGGVISYDTYLKIAMERGFEPMAYLAIKALCNYKTDIAELLRSCVNADDFIRCGKSIGPALQHYVETVYEARQKK